MSPRFHGLIRLGLAAAALAAALAAPQAGAYVRATDGDTGACLHWAERSVPYLVNPDRAGSSPSCGPLDAVDGPAMAAVQASFAHWGAAQRAGAPCTDLQATFAGTSTSRSVGYLAGGPNENLVVFRRGFCSTSPNTAGLPCRATRSCDGNTYNCYEDPSAADQRLLALTSVTYDTSTGRILDADLEIVDWTGELGGLGASTSTSGWYLTCFDPTAGPSGGRCTAYGQGGSPDCYYVDLESLVTHEAGHFFGLGHPPVPTATMYASLAAGEVDKRSLDPDDVEGICAVYPAGAPPATCATPKPAASGGCATGGSPGLLTLLLVSGGLALRIRRARPRAG